METILPTAMHRKIQLLNLLRSTNNWLFLEEVAKGIDSSKKTVITDCKYIEERWPEIVKFETSQKNGLRMIESADHSINEIFADIIKETISFSLLEAVFFEPGKGKKYWEQKFFISISSLYRMSKSIDDELRMRKIRFKRNPYKIEGENERQIRYFFAAYFLEIYGIHEWPFTLERDRIFALAAQLNSHFDLKLDYFQLVDLVFLIAVTIIRQQQANFITVSQDNRSAMLNSRIEKMKKYVGDIQKIGGASSFVLPDNWSEDFSYTIFWWEFGWDNKAEKQRVNGLSAWLIETIAGALGIPISKDSKSRGINLFESIYAKHKIFPYNKYMIYNRKLFSSHTVKQNFAVFTKVVRKVLKQEEAKSKFPWYTMYFDEILLDLFIRWENLPDLLDSLRHPVKTEVCSDLGPEHAELLAYFLKKNYREKVELTVQKQPFFFEMKENTILDSELFISNFTPENIAEEKLFIIEDIPSVKNIMDLNRKIDQHRLAVLARELPYLNE